MKKEHIFHGDLVREDITFQFTSVSPQWIPADSRPGGLCTTINSISSHYRLTISGGLSVGATVVLYDGSPFAPRKEALFEFIASQKSVPLVRVLIFRVTSWGTSPKYLAEIQASGIVPSMPRHEQFD